MSRHRPKERETFYDRMAADSDWDAATNPHETARRLDLIFRDVVAGRALTGLTFLDAGSGGGHFSAEACARDARVTSLDVGENLLAQVAQRCESKRVAGSVLAMPFEDGQFDIVLCTEVIEHTPEPKTALRELCRVTKPGGTLIVTAPCRLWQPAVRLATRLKLRAYDGYENFLWPTDAARTLEHGDILIDRCEGFNLLPLFAPQYEPLLARFDRLGARLPWLFVNYLLVGTKRLAPG